MNFLRTLGLSFALGAVVFIVVGIPSTLLTGENVIFAPGIHIARFLIAHDVIAEEAYGYCFRVVTLGWLWGLGAILLAALRRNLSQAS